MQNHWLRGDLTSSSFRLVLLIKAEISLLWFSEATLAYDVSSEVLCSLTVASC